MRSEIASPEFQPLSRRHPHSSAADLKCVKGRVRGPDVPRAAHSESPSRDDATIQQTNESTVEVGAEPLMLKPGASTSQ